MLSDAFSGNRLPTENTVRRIVSSFDGDMEEWLRRRNALDPRHVGDTVPATPSQQEGKTTTGLLSRAVTMRTLLVTTSVAVIVAVLGSLGAVSLLRTEGDAVTASVSDPTPTFLDPVDGTDPMQTICKKDAILAAQTTFHDDQILVEMMYSNQCMAVWGRVTRADGQAAGNTLTMRIYPRDDPESDRSQQREDSDLQSLYTTLLVEPDVDARVCGVATVTVGGEEFVQPEPICI